MSTKEASRPKPSARGYAWDRLSLQIRRRDGAYQDAAGVWHDVCRNWLEAKRLGLPAPCPHNGEDEVWACHGNSWNKYPALRLVPENIMSFCRHCDPDRNPEMRPEWWGDPKEPVIAGWERNGTRPPKWARKGQAHDRWELVGLALLAASVVLFVVAFKAHSHRPAWFGDAVTVLAVSVPLWWVKRRLLIASILIGNVLWTLLIAANVAARHSFLRPWTFGAPSTFGGFLATAVVLLALWGACVILVHAVLRRRWLSQAGRGIWHALVRLARWAAP